MWVQYKYSLGGDPLPLSEPQSPQLLLAQSKWMTLTLTLLWLREIFINHLFQVLPLKEGTTPFIYYSTISSKTVSAGDSREWWTPFILPSKRALPSAQICDSLNCESWSHSNERFPQSALIPARTLLAHQLSRKEGERAAIDRVRTSTPISRPEQVLFSYWIAPLNPSC